MLYIIRHGRTDWNDLRKLQGQTDIPLNEAGMDQAARAAEECKDVHFDVAFCSPLTRARQTAAILLSGRDVPVIYDDRLKEISFGIYEGTQNSFDDPLLPVNVLFKDPAAYKGVEGGESLDELFTRTESFLKEKVYPLTGLGKDVLIVGHGAMNSSIICQVRKAERCDFWAEPIENCKLKQLL